MREKLHCYVQPHQSHLVIACLANSRTTSKLLNVMELHDEIKRT